MNLTKKQLRVFNRLHKKYPVSLEFLDYNIERILKFIKYSLSLHFIYKCKLVQRKFRVFIRYGEPKRNIFRLKANQNNEKHQNKIFHKKIKKLQALPWSQRVVFYLKKQRLFEKIKEKNNDNENEINFDSQTQFSTSCYDDENSLSNSQSIFDVDANSSTVPENLQSAKPVNLQSSLSEEQSKSKLLEDLIDDKKYSKENNNSENDDCEEGDEKEEEKIFCEKTGTFKNILEVISESSDIIRDESEPADETIDTISNSDSEQHTSEIGENILSPEQIEQQLKTQLELLKFGKRSQTLLLSQKVTANNELEKVEETSKENPEPKLILSALLHHKRLSGEINLIDESEELSEDAGSTDIVILKASEIENRLSDELNNTNKTIKNSEKIKNNKKISTEFLTVDLFEISEKDALEAGPSSKVSPIFQDLNENINKDCSGKELICWPITNDICANSNNAKSENSFENAINTANDLFNKFHNVADLHRKKTGIIDSLMSKLGNNLDNKNNKEENREKPFERRLTVKTVEQLNNFSQKSAAEISKAPFKVQEDCSSSSDDFFGFNTNEIIPPELPGMLPTPAVASFSSISAFISKDDKHNVPSFRYTNLPKQYEDGLVRSNCPPPKFEMAAFPEEMAKPRTLAEKRIIFSKQRSFKYFMIENENTIYHELKRRSRDGRVNSSFVRSVQRSKVPASRDLWKAACWLLTENEKFYFQVIQVDGIECRILSGLGNFQKRRLPSQYSSPLMKKDLKPLEVKECPMNCPGRKAWQIIRIRFKSPKIKRHISQLKKLKIFKEENRPGPLSFKKRLFKDLDGKYNQLEIYNMPKIELEVYPKLNKPLDDYIKSYLKLILPSESITKEWAEFAVSTLVEKADQYNNTEKTNEKNQGKILQAKKSFKFTIPYLNDQTRILVRRVLTRSESFDDKENLKFRDAIKNTDDENAIQCADVLSDMIDSVALGLSENSFINDDPDIDYNKNNQGAAVIQQEPSVVVTSSVKETSKELINGKDQINSELEKKNSNNKRGRNPKAKLMAELKRLNATVINTSDAKVAKSKVCEKDFCRLGCICVSLGSNHIPKKHCMKVKCMLEKCTCPLTLIEAGNSVITSEDAFILRQKATARLARMEREFTSTVVLTGNETLLINENQTKRKRRNNARLSNYYIKGLEEDESNVLRITRSKNASQSHSNLSPTSTDNLSYDGEFKRGESPVKEARLPIDIDNICYIDEDIMKSLKHCTVDLYRLENLNDKVIWCMVHCLYKCFCNGKDIEGKPYILKKQEEDKVGEIYTRKAKYSFDKSEDENSILEPPKSQPKNEKNFDKNKDNLSSTNAMLSHNKNESQQLVETIKEKPNTIITTNQIYRENRTISAYINNDFYGCHRVQPVPQAYKVRNKRKNRWKIFPENEKTKFLLDERVRLSEMYIRKVIIKRPPSSGTTTTNLKLSLDNDNSNISDSTSDTNTNSQISPPFREVSNNSEINSPFIGFQKTKSDTTSKQMSLIKPEVRAKLKTSPSNEASTKHQQPKQGQSSSRSDQASLNFNSNTSTSTLTLFRISSVMSLNEQQNLDEFEMENQNNPFNMDKNKLFTQDILNKDQKQHQNLISSLQLLNSNCMSTSNREQFTLAAEQVQREVMKRLNYFVTKTIHNITKIESEENPNIPNPQVDMLVAIQWKHFLHYYIEDKIHIWQVKIDKATYFVGTMKHIMPYVVNAIGIVNIKAIRREKLPLFVKMLNAKFMNTETQHLSILMAGCREYWRILCMTKSNHIGARSGVIRPTTESHPTLTPKINKLFNILTQQYVESMKRKSNSFINKQVAPTSIASFQHSNPKQCNLNAETETSQQNQLKNKQSPLKYKPNATLPAMVVINNRNLISGSSNGNVGIPPAYNRQASGNSGNLPFTNNIYKSNNLNSLKMNIKIRKLTKEEALNEHFQVPLTSNVSDHRWLVLDLEDDFSHIIFGNSMETLTYSKIKLALQRSQTEKKMVRFPKVDGHSVDCYIMKFDTKRIYLGPFHETIDPVLILYQRVDGKMIIREEYERLRGIKREKHTTGFWLCRKNGKITFDLDPLLNDMKTLALQQQQQQKLKQQLHNHQNISGQLLQQQQQLQQHYLNETIITPFIQNSRATATTSNNNNQNSIIQIVPENMPLIQSQCNNLLVSDLKTNKNANEINLSSNNSFNHPGNSLKSNCNRDTSALQQKIITQVNKMIKKPCIITSITENQPNCNLKNSNKFESSQQINDNNSNIATNNNSNMLAKPVLLSGSIMIEDDEPPAKKLFLNENAPLFFQSNIMHPIQDKSDNETMDVQIKDTQKTPTSKALSNFGINDTTSVPSSIVTHSSTSTFKKIVYGPHMQTPSLSSKQTAEPSRNITISPKSTVVQPSLQPVQKLQISTSAVTSATSTSSFSSVSFRKIAPKPITNPSQKIRPININVLRSLSKDPIKKVDPKFIGKYNEVIISKTESNGTKDLNENRTINNPVIHNFLANSLSETITAETSATKNEKVPVTAEIKEQDGQLILKLPENLQNKIVSQQFTVSKKEDGTIILEPSKLPTLASASKCNLNSKSTISVQQEEPSQLIINKVIPSKEAISTISSTISTTTSSLTIPAIPVPIVSTSTTSSTSSAKINEKHQVNIGNQTTKHRFVIKRRSSGILTLTKETSVEDNKKSDSVSKTVSNSLNTETITPKLSLFQPKSVTLSNATTTAVAAITTPIISSKIKESDNKQLPSSVKRSEIKSSEKQSTTSNTTVESTTTITSCISTTNTISATTKSKNNADISISDVSTEKPRTNHDKISRKVSYESDKELELIHKIRCPEKKLKLSSEISDVSKEKPSTNHDKISRKISHESDEELELISEIRCPEKKLKLSSARPNNNSSNSTKSIIAHKSQINTPMKNIRKSLPNFRPKFNCPGQLLTKSGTISLSKNSNKDVRKLFTAKRLTLPTFSNLKSSSSNNTSVSPQKSMKIITIPASNKNLPSSSSSSSSSSRKRNFSYERVVSISNGSNSLKGFTSGYFISNVKDYPKFGGYRKGNDYLIKTNIKSALQLPSIADVTKHLNSFVKKHFPTYQGEVKWDFVSFRNHFSSNTEKSKSNESGGKKNLEDPLKTPENSTKKCKVDSLKGENNLELNKLKTIEAEKVIVIDDDEDDELR